MTGTASSGIPFGFGFIRSSHFLVKKSTFKNRTWRERLFSWPWNPLVKYKVVITSVPDPKVYISGNMILGHPQTIDRIERDLDLYGQADYPVGNAKFDRNH